MLKIMIINDIFQNEYILALAFIIGSVLFSKIIQIILKQYLKKLTSKTKTDIDDLIIDAISVPLYFGIMVIGAYFALKVLSIVDGYTGTINKIFFVLLILFASLIVTRLIGVLVPLWLKVQKKHEKTPLLIKKGINIIVYIIAFLMILSYFKIEITPLVATLGLGGLAIGLALQNTLSNFFAGIHILSDKPVHVGDFIELKENDVSGYVEDIGWRSTRLRTLPNTIIIIPNSKLAESIIINDSLPEQEMAALVQCGVSYDSDLEKVERVTIDVAKYIQKNIPGAIKTFNPFIRYHTFGDSNINFTVILRVEKFVDKYLITHEFIKALKKRYDKEKIEISWPVRKIYRGR